MSNDEQQDVWTHITDTQLGFVRLWMECISRQLHTPADDAAPYQLISAQAEFGFQCSKALLDQSGKVLDSLFGGAGNPLAPRVVGQREGSVPPEEGGRPRPLQPEGEPGT